MADRMSFWAWGLESEEPTEDARRAMAKQLSETYGVSIEPRPIPDLADADLRSPRSPHRRPWPTSASPTPTSGPATPAAPTSPTAPEPSISISRTRRILWPTLGPKPSWRPSSTGVTTAATPRCPSAAGRRWCGAFRPRTMPGPASRSPWTASTRCSRSTRPRGRRRIQAGVLGPALEDQLKPSGHTLRHFPADRSGSRPSAAGSPPAPAGTTPPTTPTSTTSSSRCAC